MSAFDDERREMLKESTAMFKNKRNSIKKRRESSYRVATNKSTENNLIRGITLGESTDDVEHDLSSISENNTHAKRDTKDLAAYTIPMFDVSWALIIGVLSQIIEDTDGTDSEIMQLSLQGFEYAIHLGMPTLTISPNFFLFH